MEQRRVSRRGALFALPLAAVVFGLAERPAAEAEGARVGGGGAVAPGGAFWAKTVRLEAKGGGFLQEKFHRTTEHTDPEIVEAFGSKTPPSGTCLLHYAKGWDTATRQRPVILLHGAGLNANTAWSNDVYGGAFRGLADRLSEAGFAVFAISFAHPHGCNFLQREMLAEAIAAVREATGARKVDLVAHSKGALPARMYLSNVKRDWGVPYRRDVERYVMMGAPNLGIDVAFAYSALNYYILENDTSAPTSWTRCLYRGTWVDTKEWSIYAAGGAFPGQSQMLYRWDRIYGLVKAKEQLDWYTTYNGGPGYVSEGGGIDKAIAEGEDLIAQLEEHGVHKSVRMSILAGCCPRIIGYIGERRGPSDGILLLRSALHSDGLERAGAKGAEKRVLFLNHLELTVDERAAAWVVSQLGD